MATRWFSRGEKAMLDGKPDLAINDLRTALHYAPNDINRGATALCGFASVLIPQLRPDASLLCYVALLGGGMHCEHRAMCL